MSSGCLNIYITHTKHNHEAHEVPGAHWGAPHWGNRLRKLTESVSREHFSERGIKGKGKRAQNNLDGPIQGYLLVLGIGCAFGLWFHFL